MTAPAVSGKVTRLRNPSDTVGHASLPHAATEATHFANVAILSILTALKLDRTREDLIDVGLGALLHDVGKLRPIDLAADAHLYIFGEVKPEEFGL